MFFGRSRYFSVYAKRVSLPLPDLELNLVPRQMSQCIC